MANTERTGRKAKKVKQPRPKWWDLALLVRASLRKLSDEDKRLFIAVAFEEPNSDVQVPRTK
jgi:hypothetical protein